MWRIYAIGMGFVFVVGSLTFYFLHERQIGFTGIAPFSLTMTPQVIEARQVPDGWKEYRNNKYGFSLLYQEELEVKEYPEKGDALTITFQDAEDHIGFQVFIVPYQESQISEERFKRDIPSGVRVGETGLEIDGVKAVAFYSKNGLLGETREIWFIHNGFLFEATTLKSLESWLSAIMQTWEFL